MSTEAAVAIVKAVRSRAPGSSSGNRKSSIKADPSQASSESLAACVPQLKTLVAASRPLFVGVFADQPMEEVNKIAEAVDLDFIQLSGKEGFGSLDSYVRPVLKAIHVAGQDKAPAVISSIPASFAVGVLLDTFDPAARGSKASSHLVGAEPFVPWLGGTGRAFSWDVARDVNRSIPIFLAGGLNVENIEEAIATVRPLGVDVSSGVEGVDGQKDVKKIQDFIKNAK